MCVEQVCQGCGVTFTKRSSDKRILCVRCSVRRNPRLLMRGAKEVSE